jgi:SAM-dependent methyltransferase
VSREDRRRWDEKHAAAIGARGPGEEEPPSILAAARAFLPRRGTALDVACGRGAGTIALARAGLRVTAVDVSLVALAEVRRAAEAAGVARAVRTIVADLDEGLPPDVGTFDVVLCRHFHAPSLWPSFRAALAPGGVLVMETLTRENVALGLPAPSAQWLIGKGEILVAAEGFDVLVHDEALHDGRHVARLVARLVARRPPRTPEKRARRGSVAP